MSNINSGHAMKAGQVVSAIKTAYAAKRPLFIHGQPGAGKSDLVRQAAKELGIELRDVRASQLESVDLRGLPFIEQSQTHWSKPNFLPDPYEYEKDAQGRTKFDSLGNPVLKLDAKNQPIPTKGIVFLDELNQANQSTQAASYQLILDRRLGDYELPPGWVVVAAGNRGVDKAIANKMGSALKNRFVHIEMLVDVEEWLNWAAKSNIHPSVLGYIRYRSTGLNDLAGVGQEGKKRMEAALEGNAFATPRSWYFASEIIYTDPDPSVEHALLAGTIGDANVADFVAFLRVYRDLPDLDALIKEPAKFDAPTDARIRYAITSGLCTRATKDNFGSIMKFMNKMPKEFQVLLVKDAQARDWNICASKAYTEWLDKNSASL
jgi:hypothetical protein